MIEDNRFEWSGDLSVNNEKIDTQHKEIFDIIDLLSMVKPDNSENGRFAQILSILTQYGLSHLKEEEEFMADNGYPKLEEHKKVHKSYLFKVAMFNLNYYKTSETEVVDFLRNWWVNHIAKMDIQYRDYIESKKGNAHPTSNQP